MNSSLHAQTMLNRRIQRVGAIGRTCCSIFLMIPAAVTCLVVADSVVSKTEPRLVFFAMSAFWIAGILIMRRLFVLLARQELFTRQSGRLIQWLGIWQFLWGVRFNAAADRLSDVVYSYQIKEGLVLNFKPELILTGLFLVALGWGMNLAASLKQEQDLTV